MKINKNFKIAIFSFLVFGLATATVVSAYQGTPNNQNDNNPITYQERVEKIKTSHENMSAEDLEKRNEIHKLMINGEYEEALKIKDELGIGRGVRQGMKHGNKNKTRENMPNFIDTNNNGLCDNMEDIEIN